MPGESIAEFAFPRRQRRSGQCFQRLGLQHLLATRLGLYRGELAGPLSSFFFLRQLVIRIPMASSVLKTPNR
eukprot:6516488-Pyramimonas_sp.AAC.1